MKNFIRKKNNPSAPVFFMTLFLKDTKPRL